MFRKPHYIAFGLVAVLAVVLLSLPTRTTNRLKLAISSLFLPLFGLATASGQLVEKTANTLTPRSELIRQNEALRRENEQLRLQMVQNDQLARENARLRELFQQQKLQPWKLQLAKVVVRDPSNWWRTVQIDAGTLQGVRENQAVLLSDGNGLGLVGKIESAGLTRSQVVLLGDPHCRVSAKIKESGDTGIIDAADPLDRALVRMGYLSRGTTMKPGQTVITSGLGLVFPPGIPIGAIVDLRSLDLGVTTEARVKLAADPGALDHVWVLIQ